MYTEIRKFIILYTNYTNQLGSSQIRAYRVCQQIIHCKKLIVMTNASKGNIMSVSRVSYQGVTKQQRIFIDKLIRIRGK
jgi:hypothetical protein